MPKSDIPFGSEFSPAVIELPELLELVAKHAPDRIALQKGIDTRFFPGKGKNADPRKTLADNTILSMLAYGILQRRDDHDEIEFTEFGKALHKACKKPNVLRDVMGKHCMTTLRGLLVVNCIQDMTAAGTKLTKLTIVKELRKRGLHYPENGKHLNVLRQWLDFAGVLNPDDATSGEALWMPSSKRIEELLGVTTDDLDKWSTLNKAQYDFARAFAVMGCQEAKASEVRDYAVNLYGTEFPEGGLPQSVLKQLENAGLLEMTKTTGGRGAKSHVVKATEKLTNEFLPEVLELTRDSLGQVLKKLVRMNLDDILRDLGSDNTHKKGVALEALAFYFCRRLDLEFVGFRLRSTQTGGAEVDVIVEGARLIFSRWQIQCKNKKMVNVEDVAKEVGLATAMRTNVVMLVTTGKIGPYVDKFSEQVMQNTSMQVILIDGKNLNLIKENVTALVSIMNSQARRAMEIKRPQLGVKEE